MRIEDAVELGGTHVGPDGNEGALAGSEGQLSVGPVPLAVVARDDDVGDAAKSYAIRAVQVMR